MKKTRIVLLSVGLGLLSLLVYQALSQPAPGGGGPFPKASVGSSGGIGYTNTFYNATNYFAVDANGNTNGPLSFYRLGYGPALELMDITLGVNSKFAIVGSLNPGDQAYGGIVWNTDHGGDPGSLNNMELGFASSRDMAFAFGSGNANGGHLQIGNVNGLGGYSAFNQWAFFTVQGPNGQTTSTNFSGALVFETGEMQGANYTQHYPGMYAYSTKTNAPGEYHFAITADLGNAATAIWDPNTAKAGRWIDMAAGSTGYINFLKGSANPTNLMPIANAPDFAIPVQTFVSNNVVQFQPCTNVDATATLYQTCIVFLTNNLAAGNQKAIIAPVNCRTSNVGTGVPFVTNLTKVVFEQYGQKWTNMACYPIF